MIKLTTFGALVLLLAGCAQFQQTTGTEDTHVYKMTRGKAPDITLRVSFSFDWMDDVFEWEIPFAKKDVGDPQSIPQTLKVKEHADGSDFWCDSITLFTHESSDGVKVQFSYAYSRSPDEIKSDGQINFLIPFGKDGQSEEDEMSCKWKWIDAK